MTVIHNAEIVNEQKRFCGYVVIEGAFIKEVGAGEIPECYRTTGVELIDACGAVLIPGCIDDHVHFREPGLTGKATIATESRAAVAGGVTSFMDMPNTKPLAVSRDTLEDKFRRAAETSAANYSFFIGATNDNADELLKVDYSDVCGVKLFLGASTGNMLVDGDAALRRIFSEVPAIVSVHSEDEAIIKANREHYTKLWGSDLSVFFHPMIRSAEACYVCTARAVEAAVRYGTRLHVAHISTERELALFSPGEPDEKLITAEACVHHLWFTDNDYASLGTLIKCNPAIKTTADRNALRRAVNDSRIDIIATDHAPHLLQDKLGGALTAASGTPYVQFSLLMMLELVRQGVFTIEQVVNKMSHSPARLYGIDRRGFIRPGYYADLVIVDTGTRHTISNDEILSLCGWSPLEGYTFHSRVVRTFVNGECVYDRGKFNDKLRGMRLKFKNKSSR